MSSESTEFCRDRWFIGTDKNPTPRSPDLDVTGLETLWGLVGLLSRFSKAKDVSNSGLEGRCDIPLVDTGSDIVVGLTASSCMLEGFDSWGGSVEILGLTAVVSMVMVGLRYSSACIQRMIRFWITGGPLSLCLNHIRATPHGRMVIVIGHVGSGSAAMSDSLELEAGELTANQI